ncbi:ASCH domain-containing protein [Ruminococcaceae bacterium BL-6]|nr:ASCH domain-containing protein [Ruminococcaceae bacterium BL-6]
MITLPTKKKWFDMIKSGEKKEEYRKDTPYYESRFDKYIGHTVQVKFRNGYRKDSPSCICMVIPHYGRGGRPEWGAELEKDYIVLTIRPEGEDLKNDLSVL